MATNNPFTIINEANADAVYEKVLPEAMALSPESLLTINLDLGPTIITGMAVSERLPAFYEALKALPQVPIEKIEKFPEYVLALYVAQSYYTKANAPANEMADLLEEATRWRDILIAYAKVLIARGQLSAELLKELTGTHGYANVAFDVRRLSSIFKAAWPQIEGSVGLKSSELVEVDRIALKLAATVAHRTVSPEQMAATTDIRQRMFTLFYQTYDQIRRSVGFLRWNEDDADDFVPSLYAGRPNTNIAKKNNNEANGAAATPLEVPGNGNTQSPVAAAAATNKVPVGHPNSEPLGAA
jgi:hypothetical protein